jgi:hypothetical protein
MMYLIQSPVFLPDQMKGWFCFLRRMCWNCFSLSVRILACRDAPGICRSPTRDECRCIVRLSNQLCIRTVVWWLIIDVWRVRPNVFHSKVVDDESEHDRARFVFPKPRYQFALVISMLVESFLKELVCKESCLWQAIHSFCDFEKYHSILVDYFVESILFDYFFWEVQNLESNVFWPFERHVEIKVANIHHHESCTRSGNDTVEEYFCYQHFGCRHGNFAWIVDFVASSSEACTIRFVNLFGAHVAHKTAVGYIFMAVFGDVLFTYESNGFGWVFDVSADAFGESTEFICRW